MRAAVRVVLALCLLAGVLDANVDYAEKIAANVQHIKSLEDVATHALTYGSGGDNPLAIPQEHFAQMYKENKDIWGDCSPREAWLNYVRSQSGNVDSARLLMEFSMVPSVKSGGSKLHVAAATGEEAEVKRVLDEATTTALVDPVKSDGTTPLLSAAMMGHDRIVEMLLEEGADPEAAGMNGATALMVSASMGHTKVMQALFRHGADPSAKHKFAGSTALHFAAEMGQAAAVELLCKSGADVEAAKIQGGTALHIAADSNQSAIARVLVSPVCRAKTDSLLLGDTTPLYLAAQKGFLEVVRVLLDGGANRDYEMPVGTVGSALSVPVTHKTGAQLSVPKGAEDEFEWVQNLKAMHQKGSDPTAPGFEAGNGATALHAAAENGHLEVVRLLLERGVKQSSSMEGASPLYIAAQYNKPRIADLLLEHGADVDVQLPRDGATSLFIATGSGYLGVVEVLLRHGANASIPNKYGATPVSFACRAGRLQILTMLVKRGANLMRPIADGFTCLHVAVQAGQSQLVDLLLQNPRLDPDVAASDDQTPLHLAAEHRRAHLMELLLAKGATVDARVASTGATPLMMAARAGSGKSVALLLAAGADVAAKGRLTVYGATALYMAAQRGHAKVVQRLLDAGADADARLSIRTTPVMAATDAGSIDTLRVLLDHGAAVNVRDVHHNTPLILATDRKRGPLVRFLLERGARPDLARKSDGRAALHLAVAAKHLETAELLLEHGACLSLRDAAGASPHDLAMQERHFETLKLLGHYSDRNTNCDGGDGGGAGGGEADAEEEDEPTIVRVSRVEQDGKMYLVDKASGTVYSNDADSPEPIGSWSRDRGVRLSEPAAPQHSEL